MMSRQAGKNELSGQLEAYLLNLYRLPGGQIVKASPTFKPQTVNSLLRLCDRLDNAWNAAHSDGRYDYRRREGYMVQLGRGRTLFFSAEPTANVVGATADLLLEGDEAQDIAQDKWYKDFTPMAASTNATTVLYGTAWTSDTLLARTIQHLQQQQTRDGIRRVFQYDAGQVAAARTRLRQIRHAAGRPPRPRPPADQDPVLPGDHRRRRRPIPACPPRPHARRPRASRRSHEPEPGRRYALLIDVAGEEEVEGTALDRMMLETPTRFKEPRRDATALTVVEVDVESGRLPNYRVVDRHLWLGVKHTTLHAQIRALAAPLARPLGRRRRHRASAPAWPPSWRRPCPTASSRYLFSPKTKSDLGWAFLGAVETGRYRDYSG